MSATNRGAIKEVAEFYPTPIKTTLSLLEHYPLNPNGIILEPCAGNGNMIQALRQAGYTNPITAVEIRAEEEPALYTSGATTVHIGDFFNAPVPAEEVTTIIMNPPFSLAMEFMTHCFEKYPNADVIVLLRIAYLESKTRYDFWQNHPVKKLFVLSERPKFINNKSDATGYAFYVFSKNGEQEIKVIKG